MMAGGGGQSGELPFRITQAQTFGLPLYRVVKATRKGCVCLSVGREGG